MRPRLVLKTKGWGGHTVINRSSFSLVGICRGVGTPSSSTPGDLAQFVNERLRQAFHTIWFVGGGALSGDCLRLGLADEVRYSILPILLGNGIPFFERLDKDIALHLSEVKAYKSGIVALCYDVRRQHGETRNAA